MRKRIIPNYTKEEWAEKSKNRQEKIQNIPHSRVLGFLMGEIIWLRLLSNYTENGMIATLVTPEEREEYLRLDNAVIYNKDNSPHPTFLEYRNYSHELESKYFPATVKYESMITFHIEDINEFYEGIETYLWNTDECAYIFKVEDIKITTDYLTTLEITFTLNNPSQKK